MKNDAPFIYNPNEAIRMLSMGENISASTFGANRGLTPGGATDRGRLISQEKGKCMTNRWFLKQIFEVFSLEISD